MVERQVTGLLNKLAKENFASISDRIIQWANKSENEKEGRTLIQVIRLVFKNAANEAKISEIYACLCRKMIQEISPKVQVNSIKDIEGKPIAGGQLFRKYLLNRCQEDFERNWLSAVPMSTEDSSASVLSTRLRSNEDGKDSVEEADLASHAEPARHRRLIHQARSKPLEAGSGEYQSPADGLETGSDAVQKNYVVSEVSEEAAKKKIAEGVKELFAVRSLSEAEVYFTNIRPAAHHHRLVDALVARVVESKEADAKLVADFFEQTAMMGTCSAEAYETGLLPVAGVIDVIAIDVPKAFQLFAMMVKGAGLDEAQLSNLACKSIDSGKHFSMFYSTRQFRATTASGHEVEVSVFVEVVIGLQNAKKEVSLFRIIAPTHHHTFIAKVAEAALAIEGEKVTIIAESRREAVSQGACSLKNYKKGLAMVARMMSKAGVTTHFLKLAMMVRGVGLNKADCEEITTVFGPLSNSFMAITPSIGQSSDAQTMAEFLEQLIRMGMCSF